MTCEDRQQSVLHKRRPSAFQAVQSASRGIQVVINDSAPLRVERRETLGGDVGLVCLPVGQPVCKIASNWPVLVYAQAGIETVYYRQRTYREYGDLQPVKQFGDVVVPVEGNVPDPGSNVRLKATETLREMYENRDHREETAKQWRNKEP